MFRLIRRLEDGKDHRDREEAPHIAWAHDRAVVLSDLVFTALAAHSGSALAPWCASCPEPDVRLAGHVTVVAVSMRRAEWVRGIGGRWRRRAADGEGRRLSRSALLALQGARPARPARSRPLQALHTWQEGGVSRLEVRRLRSLAGPHSLTVGTPPPGPVDAAAGRSQAKEGNAGVRDRAVGESRKRLL